MKKSEILGIISTIIGIIGVIVSFLAKYIYEYSNNTVLGIGVSCSMAFIIIGLATYRIAID